MRFSSKRVIGLVTALMLMVLAQASSAQSFPPFTVPAEQPTDQWVIQVASRNEAATAAARAGMMLVGEVPNMPGYYILQAPANRARSTVEAQALTRGLTTINGVQFAEQMVLRKHVTRQTPYNVANPPWYLANTGAGIGAKLAWDAGVLGTGVRISVIDDGVEHTHPDLAANYLAADSYDYYDNDTNPFQPFASGHGTAVAGVAAALDNDRCGVGVAPDARFLGVRLLGDFPTTDAQDAAALAHGLLNKVDVVNSSWGPIDNGASWSGAGKLALQAIQRGSTIGRVRKGIVYVWAGGNGYLSGDHTGADSFVNSPFTIAVAATTNSGVQSFYSEEGSAILVNAPSDGGTLGLITTDLTDGGGTGDCMSNFGGTSGAAPVVAGVVALMLDANPNLTWRDVQAILIASAERNDPLNESWQDNDAGYYFSDKYGFGRVDADAATALAASWNNLPPAQSYTTGPVPVWKTLGSAGGSLESSVYVPADVKVEHVEVEVNLNNVRRGDVQLVLIPPSGKYVSVLLDQRPNDSGSSITKYSFLSMAHWGEMSKGTWRLAVFDTQSQSLNGVLQNWTLHINNPYRTPLKNNHLRADSNGDGLPNGWIGINRTPKQDRLITNNWFDSSIYQMRGTGSNKSSRIEQTVTETINAGTTLEFGAYANGAGQYNGGGVIRLTLNYRDGTSESRVLRLPYAPFAWGYYAQQYKLPKVLTSYKLSLGYIRSPANGIVRYDQPFVRAIAMAEPGTGAGGLSLPTLPMPDAP